MAETFNRAAAIAALVAHGHAETEVDVLADGALVDLLRQAQIDATTTETAIKTGQPSLLDVPVADAEKLIERVFHIQPSQMPDVTPAQRRAVATMAIGYATAAGVPLNPTAQLGILVGATVLPVAWIAADVVIRWSRAKHIFGAKQ